jgi:hypothetical protein
VRPVERVARGEGVVVSTSFVKSFGVGVGERFEVETPTGPLALPIVGVMRTSWPPRARSS